MMADLMSMLPPGGTGTTTLIVLVVCDHAPSGALIKGVKSAMTFSAKCRNRLRQKFTCSPDVCS